MVTAKLWLVVASGALCRNQEVLMEERLRVNFFPTFPILPLFSCFVEFYPPSQCNQLLCDLLKKKVEVFARHGIATGKLSLMF